MSCSEFFTPSAFGPWVLSHAPPRRRGTSRPLVSMEEASPPLMAHSLSAVYIAIFPNLSLTSVGHEGSRQRQRWTKG